jgi:hypothetical protein
MPHVWEKSKPLNWLDVMHLFIIGTILPRRRLLHAATCRYQINETVDFHDTEGQ